MRMYSELFWQFRDPFLRAPLPMSVSVLTMTSNYNYGGHRQDHVSFLGCASLNSIGMSKLNLHLKMFKYPTTNHLCPRACNSADREHRSTENVSLLTMILFISVCVQKYLEYLSSRLHLFLESASPQNKRDANDKQQRRKPTLFCRMFSLGKCLKTNLEKDIKS